MAPWFTLFLVLALASGLVVVLRAPLDSGRRLFHWVLLLRGARSRFLDLPPVRLHYYELPCRGEPRESPALFLTGLGGCGTDWQVVLGKAARQRHVYSLELVGQGRTRVAADSGFRGLEDQVQLLRLFLDTVQCPTVTLVGISLGGWIACRFALAFPERIERLVLVASAGLRNELTMSDMQPRDRREARTFVERLLARKRWVPAPVLDDFVRRLNAPRIRELLGSLREEDFLDVSLQDILPPVDLIWGRGDGLFPLREGQRFQAGIPGSRLHVLPDCGHVPMFECPRRFRELVMQVLESDPPGKIQ